MNHVACYRLRLSAKLVLILLVLAACSQEPEPSLGDSFQLDVRDAEISAAEALDLQGAPAIISDKAARFGFGFKFRRSNDELTWRLKNVEAGRYRVRVSARAELYQGPPELILKVGEAATTKAFEEETYQSIDYATFEVGANQELSLRFENDLWEGTDDTDRNIVVDYLTFERLEPEPGPTEPGPTEPGPTEPEPGPTEPEPKPEPTEPSSPTADAPEICEDEGVCVDGRGLQLYKTQAQQLYKNGNGWVSMPNGLPSVLNGSDFLTYDKYPDYTGDDSSYTDNRDSRTDETVARVQSDGDQLLIAVASPDAADNGWKRLNDGSNPDFVLDTEDASTPSYWLYSLDNPEPKTWLELPSAANAELPPFVFAPAGKLTFANPLPLPGGGVRIVPGNSKIFNPTLTIVPGEFDADGNGVADGDTDGDGSIDNDVYLAGATGASLWKVWRSLDEGKTWERWGKPLVNLNRQSLFWHDGGVYLMGWVKRSAELANGDPAQGIIYQSLDGGKTWGEPTLLPFDAGDAPSNVVVSNGRLWKAAGSLDKDGNHGATLISAPVGADLMNASSWTAAAGSYNPAWKTRVDEVRTVGSKDVEGVTVLLKDGRVANVSNVRGAAIVYSDGYQRTTHNPANIGNLPERGKFSVMYDPVSERYWALANGPNGQPRNVLNLFSSSDLLSWELEREVLRGPSSRFHGFNYPEMQMVGDDIVFVSRTAWETTRGHNGRWHDGNMLTFHRVEDFRQAR